jgi:16S rRNA processing protein RimM
MMPDPEGRRAGIITKPYGLQGKLNMILDPGAGKNINKGNPLFISLDGQRVPFFIEEVEQVSQDHFIVKFEFIESVEQAKKVSNCEVYQDPRHQGKLADEKTMFDQLNGYVAVDLKTGLIGTISGFIEQEYNPVFVIDRGGGEILIPANEQLIDHIDQSSQSIYFRLPEGLIDL